MIFMVTPWGSSSLALLTGFVAATLLSNPFEEWMKNNTRHLLSWSIVGLGAGLNILTVFEFGAKGLVQTFFTITLAITVGLILGKVFKNSRSMSALISVGTAICGGSAIAAVAPAINAKNDDVAVSLGVVFFLNALALFLFPAIGHYYNLDQFQFGTWSALAIHDTSSVVGASLTYGEEALKVGATLKLTRSLWIIPITFIFAKFYKGDEQVHSDVKVKVPWFIFGFLANSILFTYVTPIQFIGGYFVFLAKKMMIMTLFFIGCSLSLKKIKEVGLRPLFQGVILWLIVASSSLILVLQTS